MNLVHQFGHLVGIGAVALLAGCMVGPNYQRATAPTPATYKELPPMPDGWKSATPNDAVDRGQWWSIYQDPFLDELERKVSIDNQNLKAYEAGYRQALALVGEARSNLLPTISLKNSLQQSTLVPGITPSHKDAVTSSIGTAVIGANWDLDLWGKIRRQVEGERAAAQASAAQLASARLSAQADLASDYFELRYEDSLERLLEDSVAAYERTLEITRKQYVAGAAAKSDVMTAQAQLQTAQAQLIAVGVSRAQYEHAIALLIGQPPAGLTISPAELAATVPVIPVALPSTLLERRPDIAQAERLMKQQNAQIGVAIAAYYPDISLSGMFGYVSTSGLVSASNQLWSSAANASALLVDGGGRSATVRAARAAYDQSVAQYRQTVLTAFHDVEDALSSLRVLAQQSDAQEAAVASSRESLELALREYQTGAVAYTAVVTAQVTALTNEEAALQVKSSRLSASVALLKALGGGWQASTLEGSDRP
jgi:NodT family efflux transporter outer membrane factor (OMF) lipoprotein